MCKYIKKLIDLDGLSNKIFILSVYQGSLKVVSKFTGVIVSTIPSDDLSQLLDYGFSDYRFYETVGLSLMETIADEEGGVLIYSQGYWNIKIGATAYMMETILNKHGYTLGGK